MKNPVTDLKNSDSFTSHALPGHEELVEMTPQKMVKSQRGQMKFRGHTRRPSSVKPLRSMVKVRSLSPRFKRDLEE